LTGLLFYGALELFFQGVEGFFGVGVFNQTIGQVVDVVAAAG
jgi:hypothetical protein